MSERTDDPGFQDYSWTDDVNHTLGPLEVNPGPSQAAPGYNPQGNGDPTQPFDPDAAIIRAPKEGEGGWNSRMPYNKYMENPFVQAFSGFAKGIVRGVGLEVHPSLGYDTPIEERVSGLTKALHPGLDAPKALTMAVLQASGTPLTDEQRQAKAEGLLSMGARYVPGPASSLYNVLNKSKNAVEGLDSVMRP
ncbi:hypothetical protein [Fundidesulfovibrio agrisoli]|uniref:hypothetical protein n=1 Tax=Fundidesulfovibrio agrisoli TaxID=2922717 RepID=UPI001FACB8DF|nr:hypothetical protein [Fundidesulfovibrio agrisoli]